MSRVDPVPSDSRVAPSDKQWYYEQMCRIWGIEPRDASRNPCPLAVPMRRDNMRECSPDDYMVTPKTDGVRYLLLLTVTPEDARPVAVMIGRDMEMYEVQVWGTEDLFTTGTLLDGELALCKGAEPRAKYFAFDAMAVAGEKLVMRPLCDRLCALRALLELSPTHRQWLARYTSESDDTLLQFIVEEKKVVCTPNNLMDLSLCPKHMVTAQVWARDQGAVQWGETTDARDFDGLVFTPVNTPVYLGTHRKMFKWKPAKHCTVDVEVRAGAVRVRGEQGEAVALDTCCDRPVRIAIDESAGGLDDGVYECRMELAERGIALHPVRQRTDKDRANNIHTVQSVLGCLTDDITEPELMRWFGGGGDP